MVSARERRACEKERKGDRERDKEGRKEGRKEERKKRDERESKGLNVVKGDRKTRQLWANLFLSSLCTV